MFLPGGIKTKPDFLEAQFGKCASNLGERVPKSIHQTFCLMTTACFCEDPVLVPKSIEGCSLKTRGFRKSAHTAPKINRNGPKRASLGWLGELLRLRSQKGDKIAGRSPPLGLLPLFLASLSSKFSRVCLVSLVLSVFSLVMSVLVSVRSATEAS